MLSVFFRKEIMYDVTYFYALTHIKVDFVYFIFDFFFIQFNFPFHILLDWLSTCFCHNESIILAFCLLYNNIFDYFCRYTGNDGIVLNNPKLIWFLIILFNKPLHTNGKLFWSDWANIYTSVYFILFNILTILRQNSSFSFKITFRSP